MRIESLKTLILRVEVPEMGNSQGWTRERAALLIEVRTEDGLVGLGEAYGSGGLAAVRATATIIESWLGPMVLHSDPRDTELLWHRMYGATREHGRKGVVMQAISAMDMAFWDLRAKAVEQPLFRLLGGRFRTRVTPYASGFMYGREPDAQAALSAVANDAEKLAQEGFTHFKLRIGRSPATDVERMRAVRDATGPHAQIAADANGAYTRLDALAVGNRLGDLGCAWLEEPIAPEDRAGYAELRSRLMVPVSGGEAEYSRWGFQDLFEGGCVDIVQPEVCALGGITEFQKVVALASSAFVRVIPHVWGSAVALACNLHLLAALPVPEFALSLSDPLLELDITPNPLRDEVLADPLDLAEQIRTSGAIALPDDETEPGLGISLDEDAVRRFVLREVMVSR